jgi:hypothetical protein
MSPSRLPSNVRALLALLALAVGACGHTEVSAVVFRVPEAPRSPRVAVYFPRDPVTRPYYDVAMIQIQSGGSDATMGDVMEAFTHRAHALGCDALVRTQIALGAGRLNAVAVCVRFTDEATAAKAPSPAPAPATAPATAAPDPSAADF